MQRVILRKKEEEREKHIHIKMHIYLCGACACVYVCVCLSVCVCMSGSQRTTWSQFSPSIVWSVESGDGTHAVTLGSKHSSPLSDLASPHTHILLEGFIGY